MAYNWDEVRPKKSSRWLMLLAADSLALIMALPVLAQQDVKPFTPFKVIGNIYYVGDTNECVYLITTPAGHILLDTGYAETVPIVKAGVEKLGFQMRDIKIMISGHAHSDHVAGHALVKQMTGARILASELDAPVIESGGARGDYRGPRANPWTPAKVGGVKFNVAFMPSVGRNEGVHVFNYPNHPTIAEDYQKTFRVLKTLPCEVFLGPHGNFFDLNGKFARMQAGAKENPFVDPVGCRQYVERGEAAFLKQLEEERQTRK